MVEQLDFFMFPALAVIIAKLISEVFGKDVGAVVRSVSSSFPLMIVKNSWF